MRRAAVCLALIALLAFFIPLFCASCTPGNDEGASDTVTEPATNGNTASAPETTSPAGEDTTTAAMTAPPTVHDPEKTIKFLVFSDLHYKKNMYVATVADVEKIMKRADDNGVDFVIQLGDFCNDYYLSPELFDTYLGNEYGLPAYGVCGNHDMEGTANSLSYIKTKLCNRAVTFGRTNTESVTAYWYTDIKNFRIIGLDTNYSYSPTKQAWEHNRTNSSHAPSENEKSTSLGPEQLLWLRERVKEASQKKMKVLVFSHVSFSDSWSRSPDAAAVREIFSDYPETVLLATNGHSHTDHFKIIEKTAFFDVNSVRNGYWYGQSEHHYTIDQTYDYLNYVSGVLQGDVRKLPLTSLSQGKNTWFFTDPLSAVVTVTEDGYIRVEGAVTRWMYDVVPESKKNGTKPMIGYYVYDGNEVN